MSALKTAYFALTLHSAGLCSMSNSAAVPDAMVVEQLPCDADPAKRQCLEHRESEETVETPSGGYDHSRANSADLGKNLGIAKDVVGLGDKGVTVGFGIARWATKAGFGIASACIGKSSELIEHAAGPNPVSSGLNGVGSVVGFAQKVTHGCQDIAEKITHVSLDATKAGLKVAGAQDNALLRVVVGDEVTEAVTLVETIVTQYTHEMVDVPLQDLLAAASAWGALQHASIAVDGPRGEADVLPQHSERFMRYSAATMGTAWFAGLVDGFSASALARAKAIKDQGGAAGDCAVACAGLEGRIEVVKFEERTNELYAPGYLVAVDHELGCVVVALRGTSSVADALTDLVCEPAAIQLGGQDGIAHGGMLTGAQRLDPVLAALVEEGLGRIASQVPRRVVICGHSLGAGVAALLAALWRDRGYLPGVDIQCFAFACPQVLDLSLAVAQSNHTTSVIVGADLVPRFSLATARDLQAAMLCLNNPESKGLQPSLSTHSIIEAQSQGDTDRLAVTYGVVRPLVCTAAGRLFPPGRLIHLLPDQAPLRISTEVVDELLIAREMGSSHMPRAYLLAIQHATALQDRPRTPAAQQDDHVEYSY